MSARVSRFVLALAVCAFPAAAQADDRPRLAVVVVVDQLAMTQIDRYEDLFGEGGFRRLLTQGTVARDARYLGAPTVTAHGHATLATGSYADRHGIVGNEWWEHDGIVHVGHDGRYKLLTREATDKDGTAPTDLRAPTFADALRWTHPGARVVSLSMKDRGAILFGGVRPKSAIWFDAVSDRWTTSTYYSDKLPEWVPTGAVSAGRVAWERLADARLCSFLEKKETSPSACAEQLYASRASAAENPEGAGAHAGRMFPHKFPAAGEASRGAFFVSTPLADEALFDLAVKAIDAEHLGEDDVPDLLFVSASSFDYVGHEYGPESQESLDALLREDASLARLFRALDEKVGAKRYVFALSADHGVQPTPARAAREGADAGVIDGGSVVRTADAALVKAFGKRTYLGPGVSAGGFSFRAGALDGIDRTRADDVVINAIENLPGIADVYPRSLFMSHQALRGDAAAFGRSYFDGRSPDFIIQPKPLWISGGFASHGTPYLADSRVPLFFYRGGRSPVALDGIIDVASLSPTVALIVGSAPPEAAEAPILTTVVSALR
jgi:hypothetical protein